MQPADPLAGQTDIRSGTHNRLVQEKSPYLLQHAENPVDWYPWCNEAFLRAEQENKPIFLSIGYATCHWCHVMAHESFEDPEVAALLNRDFIAIKVDREERPDIDSVYMEICQQMTGTGGWPLTIVMTPDKKPFFSATYIPKETRFSMMGLLTLLPRITEMWNEKRSDLMRSGDRIIAALTLSSPASSDSEPGQDLLDEGYNALVLQFDPAYGGFGTAPKFPTPHTLLFLLRYAKRTKNTRALTMVKKTLDALRNGGIYDQLGGGIHRYSTDAQWHVPHFEKMLYDQALLVMAYSEAYQETRNPEYKKTVEHIIGYLMRVLHSKEGAFFSAEDADSPEGEGAFYVWTLQEFENALGPEDASLAALVFGVTSKGNYEDPERGTGYNILTRKQNLRQIARSLEIPETDLTLRIESILTRLRTIRDRRVHPSVDDKILCDWNGLCIAALAQAGRVFDNPAYVEGAKTAMHFVLSHMCGEDASLLHRYRNGDAAIPGFADDYAFLIHALIELYESTFDENYLVQALDFQKYLSEHFWDSRNGGFFTVADNAEELVIRKKEIYDGAIPSCNSVAFMNLLRLHRLTGDAGFEENASRISRYFSGTIRQSPSAYSWFLCGLDLADQSTEVVIAGDPDAEDTKALIQVVRSQYLPHVTVIQTYFGPQASALADIAPFIRELPPIEGTATAYVCSGHTCALPVKDPKALIALIER